MEVEHIQIITILRIRKRNECVGLGIHEKTINNIFCPQKRGFHVVATKLLFQCCYWGLFWCYFFLKFWDVRTYVRTYVRTKVKFFDRENFVEKNSAKNS